MENKQANLCYFSVERYDENNVWILKFAKIKIQLTRTTEIFTPRIATSHSFT